MRVILVVLLFALAGCAAPQDEPEDPLFGVCPQWQPGAESTAARVALDGDDPQHQQTFGTGLLQVDGRDLDVVRFTFDSWSLPEGTVQVRAFTVEDEEQRPIRDYRAPTPQLRPVLTVNAGSDLVGHEFDVHLSPVAGDGETDPDRVRLQWTLESGGPFSADFVVSYHYRVCAAP